MNDRFFLDTNILVYSLDRSEPAKRARANQLIRSAIESGKGIVSYQVVQEFVNVGLRRFASPFTSDEAERYLTTVLRPLLAVHSSYSLFIRALQLNRHDSLSWYDALIVGAALESGCGVLYSEDLQNGREFGKLKVVNPFAQQTRR